jgi:hypothetical protein
MHWLDHVIATGVYLFLLALIVVFAVGVCLFWYRLLSSLDRWANPNLHEAMSRFPAPGALHPLGRWKWGYVRDKPGGRISRRRFRACREGVLVSFGPTWMIRRQALLPWRALLDPKSFTFPRFSLLLGAYTETRIERSPSSIVVHEDVWRHCPEATTH